MQPFVLWWFGLGFIGNLLYCKIIADLGYKRRPGYRARVPASLGASVIGPVGLLPFVLYLRSPVSLGMAIHEGSRKPDLSRRHKTLLFVLPEVVLTALYYVLIIEPMFGH